MKALNLNDAPKKEELNPSDLMVLCHFCSSMYMGYAIGQRAATSTLELNLVGVRRTLKDLYNACASAAGNDLDGDFANIVKSLKDLDADAHKLFKSKEEESIELAKDDVLSYLETMYREIGPDGSALRELFPEGIANLSKEQKLDRYLEQPSVKRLIANIREMHGWEA